MHFHPKIWPPLPRTQACPQGWDCFGFPWFPRLPRISQDFQHFPRFSEDFPNSLMISPSFLNILLDSHGFPQNSLGFRRIPSLRLPFEDSLGSPMKTFSNCFKNHLKILPNLPKTFPKPPRTLPKAFLEGILGEGHEFPSKCIDFHVHLDSPGLPNPSKTLPTCSPNPSRTLSKPSLGGVLRGCSFY